MGKVTGFLEYDRLNNLEIDPLTRIKNYNEFHNEIDDTERRKQGARCMNCGVPMCQSAISLKGMVTGCPLHNLIPEWNDEIYNNNIAHAISRLLKANPFPEFTGRVCPALCEKACINGIDGEPVTIHENELYVIEKAYKEGLIKPTIPSVRSKYKVAVIGSGPSGLSLAHRLNQRGHNVTVYEKADRVGGLLMYGIPNMKLEKEVINRRKDLLEKEGVIFITNTEVGKDIKASKLLKEYDAIAIAIGSEKPRELKFENNNGVIYAVDFLTSTTKSLLDHNLEEGTYISAKGKNVVIVGGGDTGNDCVATCVRHKAKSIIQLEMTKELPRIRQHDNKWPEWPKVLKTDYGQKEAIAVYKKDPRIFSTTVKRLIHENNTLKKIEIVKVEFKDGKIQEVKGSEQIIDCDMLIVAAGFIGPKEDLIKELKLKTTCKNTIAVDKDFKTNVDKVFAVGDCERGQSLVVWAINEGRNCAKSIDLYLNGYTNLE